MRSPKKGPAIFLQTVIVLIGIAALAFLLWEPHIEGRNAHATLFEIYFKDPFLAYAYIASIPFFASLYQAFKVLGYIGQDKVSSPATVKSLRTIKSCALAIIGFVALGELFIILGDSDDRAGGVFIGILITSGSIAIAAAAAKFEQMSCGSKSMRAKMLIGGLLLAAAVGSAAAPARAPKPEFKGMELYSWKTPGEAWHFSLLAGTNRLKTDQEIKNPEWTIIGMEELKKRLAKLAEGENVFWKNLAAKPVPEGMAKALKTFCDGIKVKLERIR